MCVCVSAFHCSGWNFRKNDAFHRNEPYSEIAAFIEAAGLSGRDVPQLFLQADNLERQVEHRQTDGGCRSAGRKILSSVEELKHVVVWPSGHLEPPGAVGWVHNLDQGGPKLWVAAGFRSNQSSTQFQPTSCLKTKIM